MATPSKLSEVDIWERIIRPARPMSKRTARRILELELPEEDRARMRGLAERNRRGELGDDEEQELDHFCRVGAMLSILRARARSILDS